MRIGICGAHRVGKSTLAKLYAKNMGVDFINGSVSQVFADFGLPVDDDLTPDVRMNVQEETLERYRLATDGRRAFVTDRTPVDYIAYTLATLGQAELSDEEFDRRVAKYMGDCSLAAAKSLDLVVLVRPGIPVVPAPGKGLLSPVYIKKLDSLMVGTLSSIGVRYAVMPSHLLTVDSRLEWLQAQIKQ